MPVILFKEIEQPRNIFNEIFDPEEHHYNQFDHRRLPWGNYGLVRVPLCPNRRQVQATTSDKEKNNSADNFHVNLDVQQFTPEELTVKITGENQITVEGKHEERQDEHGFISRQFVRRFIVPEGHDVNKIETRLSSDGVLRITAPKIKVGKELEHRDIPIIQTGQPSKVAAKTSTDTTQEEKKK